MKHLKLFFALFAMLALGVGNAWAEEATLTFDNKTKRTEYSTSKQVWVENGITFTNNKGSSTSNVGDYAKPARLYKSSEVIVACSLGNITQIVFDCNTKDYATALNSSISGGTVSSDKVTVTCDGTSNTFTIAKLSGQVRLDALTVTYTSTSGGDDSTPTQLTTPANLIAASITETSATLSWDVVTNASNYSVTINGNTETVTTNSYSATGLTAGTEYTWSVVAKGDGTNHTDSEAAQHTFTTTAATTPDPEPGTGGESGSTPTEVTISFANTNQRESQDNSSQVWSNEGVTFTNNKASSTTNVGNYSNPVRLYANSEVIIEAPGNINKIVFDCNNSTYANAVKSSIGDAATVSNDKVTVELAGTSTIFNVAKLTAQVRLDNLTVTYTSSGSGSGETVLSVSPENITWKGIAASAEKSEEITVTLSNIEAVMAELSGDNPTAFSIDKDLLEASGKIIVSKNTTTIGDYAAILTITDTDTQTKTIALSMEVVADPEPTGTFEKFTGTIEEGDYVLVANETTDALKNTITSNRFDCGTVQVVDNKIVNPDKSVIWHIAANGTYWTMHNESTTKYAGGTTTKNQGALLDDVTDLAKWTITVDGEGVYTFENYGRSQQSTDANNKFLSKNSQNAYWATYASGQKNPVLYKKSDGKQSAGLVYETNKYRTKLGDSFATPTLTNPNSLNVTYSSSNNDVAEVATDGSVTIKAVGGVEITATFAGSETHRQGSATYTICVTEHAGTEADPYSVADARRVIDVMETAEGVYATGIVSEIVTAYNSEYGNITYNISANGTTTADQLQAYRGKGVNGDNFASADDVKVGDEVVVKGNLKLHNGSVYEFDADNQLISLNRTKEQAGLAYAETELTANVGEDFAEPTLTNPNSLSITYSSSNTAVATVDATTGEVTILAAGKVTITASTTGNDSYAAGSASYNITITDTSLLIATLPFEFNGKQADIEGTAGMTHSGIDADDYKSAPYLKMNTTGDWLVIHFDSEPGQLSYDIKNNSFSGGTFSVQESADGETYTDVKVHTEITETQSEEHTLLSTSRYVKFIYTEKVNGNVGLGNITISKPDNRQETGLAWDPETVTLTVGEAFTAPTLNNPYNVTGITYSSDNESLAKVNATTGVASLVADATGTATISATFEGNDIYKAAVVSYTITVKPALVYGVWELVTDVNSLAAGDKVVIVAKDDEVALSTKQNSNNRGEAEVTKNNDNTVAFGKDVQVLTLEVGSVENTFALNTGTGYLYAASSSSNHLKTQSNIDANASWQITITDGTASIVAKGDKTRNIMQYNQSSSLFACYGSASQNALCLYMKKNVKVEGETDNSTIPNQSDVTVDNAELTVTTEAEYDNMYIGNNGSVDVQQKVTVNNLYIQTTMGTNNSSQLNTTPENIIIKGDVYIDITLGDNANPQKWHAFTVPFPVDAANGVFDLNDKKLTNGVNYAIMQYHGDVRAQGKYGWKKYSGVLVPGTFYLMTVDGDERTTYRFKKVKDADLVAANTKSLSAYTGGGKTTDHGWNGVGNPTLMYGKVAYDAQILDPQSYTYVTVPASSAHFTVGTPFFIQAATDDEVTIASETNGSLAPARRAAATVDKVKVMLGNTDYTDYLYVSASEDATNEYEIGKDLAKMTMTSTPIVPQIFAQAYGTYLCMVNAPMTSNEATVALNLYAPAEAEYTLSVEEQADATVYLLYNGNIVWNLSMGEYPIHLTQGNNAGYSLVVRRENAPTDVENILGADEQTEKFIYNGKLYILHDGKVFDAVGNVLK